MGNASSTFTSLEVLLSNSLDYAGTFPPAELSLPDAYRTAHQYRRVGRHPWLMSKSVVPLGQVLETTPEGMFELGSDGSPFLFAALGRPATGNVSPADQLLRDLDAIASFNHRYRNGPLQMEIVSLESRLLSNLTDTPELAANFADKLSQACDRLGDSFCVFYEVVTAEDNYDLKPVAALVENFPLSGLKVRTGGQRIPTVDELSAFIEAGKAHELKLKATQNLHHAHSDGTEFGFVNLLAATSFHYQLADFGSEQIRECLLDTDGSHFKFLPDKLVWKQFELNNFEIQTARQTHWLCFGSCSLDEPDEYIQELKN